MLVAPRMYCAPVYPGRTARSQLVERHEPRTHVSALGVRGWRRVRAPPLQHPRAPFPNAHGRGEPGPHPAGDLLRRHARGHTRRRDVDLSGRRARRLGLPGGGRGREPGRRRVLLPGSTARPCSAANRTVRAWASSATPTTPMTSVSSTTGPSAAWPANPARRHHRQPGGHRLPLHHRRCAHGVSMTSTLEPITDDWIEPCGADRSRPKRRHLRHHRPGHLPRHARLNVEPVAHVRAHAHGARCAYARACALGPCPCARTWARAPTPCGNAERAACAVGTARAPFGGA